MDSATPVDAATPDVVFIADDDEDLLDVDEWLTDSKSVDEHAAQIHFQLKACILLSVILCVLCALIAICWKTYRKIIYPEMYGIFVPEDVADDDAKPDGNKRHATSPAKKRR